MKIPFLLSTLLACSLPVWAQPDPMVGPLNGLPFPLVALDKAEKAAVTAPIKLNLDGVTLSAALEELKKQSGVAFDFPRGEAGETLDKTLSVHLETRSFYRAFDEIMDEAGVKASLQRYDYNRPWRLSFGQSDTGKEALETEAGLFRVRLMSLNTVLSKTIQLGKTAGDGRNERNVLSVYLELLPDLRLPIVGAAQTRVTRAEDEHSRSLLPAAAADAQNRERINGYSFYSNGYNRSQSRLSLRAPTADATTLSHLEGAVVYALATKTEGWEIADLLSQPEWKREFKSGDQTFAMTLKPTLKEDGNLTVNIEVVTNRPTVNDQIGHPLMASGPVLAGLKVVDADGKPLRKNDYGGGGGSQKLTTTATFYAPQQDDEEAAKKLVLPLRLSFEAPVEVVQTEVPFAFEDVPLP